MPKSAPLYSKKEVITATRIKKSEWSKHRKLGIIPRPVGRESNEDRWQSTVINAIGEQMHLLGPDYTAQNTIDILLKELEETAAVALG